MILSRLLHTHWLDRFQNSRYSAFSVRYSSVCLESVLSQCAQRENRRQRSRSSLIFTGNGPIWWEEMTRKMVNVTRKSGPHATLILQVVMGPRQARIFWKARRPTFEEGLSPGWVSVLKAIKSPSLEFIKGLKARVYRAQPIPNCRSHNEKSSCYWWGLGN